MMTDFVSWLRKDTQIRPAIVAGIAQFQLVHVHPFVDGNGRSARLLSTFASTEPATISSGSSLSASITTATGPLITKRCKAARERGMNIAG
jgi:hypothetical protein